MPRTARIYCPDGIFHIISRCHAQEPLLRGDEERWQYLDLLGRTLERTDARALAWCIMSNHVHLVVQAGEEPLSRLTKPLNTGYAVWKNRKENRIGAVFAGRPKTILVDTEPYLLELVRYVHLNPVRAGLVELAEHSDWSSHQCYANLTTAPPWLHMDTVLSYFPPGPHPGPNEFSEYVNRPVEGSAWPDLLGEVNPDAGRELRRAVGSGAIYSDVILGSQEFAQRVIKTSQDQPLWKARLLEVSDGPLRVPGLRELTAATCVVLEVGDEEFKEFPKRRGPRQARQILTWIWVKEFRQSQSVLARYFNVGRDYVARWYRRAIDDYQELELSIRQVLEALPSEEPELAHGEPATVHIDVSVQKD